MISPSLPIQTAVYNVLNADLTESGSGTLGDLGVTGVFDEVPEGTVKPYIHWPAADFETPDNTHDSFGSRTVAEIDVWSDQHGFKEAKEIAARIVELLDHQDLTVAGHTVVAVRREFSQSLPDPDPNLRRRKLRFAFTTSQS